MASLTATGPMTNEIARALVDFSLDGSFPDEDVSSLTIRSEDLPAGIEALNNTKAKLESEIHTIISETADDVRQWKANAQSVQDDIIRSKALANDILKKSDAPLVSGKAIADIEAKAALLVRELNYNQQVREALKGIKNVNQILDQVEQARNERRILEALRLLEKSWAALDAIPAGKSVRALKLLNLRAFELKESVHQVFNHVWSALVHVDVQNGALSVYDTKPDEPMSLADAVIGLKAFKEVEKRAKQLWHDIDQAILVPRMDIRSAKLPGIAAEGNILQKKGVSDNSVKSLLSDLQQAFSFLVQRLPSDLVETISSVMMPEITTRIRNVWLDTAVPSSLQNMEEFQEIIKATEEFCSATEALGLAGLGDLREWVENAPREWVAKCRAAALDAVRTNLSQGLGNPKQVERVEKQQVSRAEGKELAANGAVASSDDHGWDASWSDEEGAAKETPGNTEAPAAGEEDDGADAWGWGDDDTAAEAEPENPIEPQVEEKGKDDDDDDAAEAWGWGDEADNDGLQAAQVAAPAPVSAPAPAPARTAPPQTREVTLKETYHISAMPEPVLDLISAILADGAALTEETYATSPVVSSASGLFSLPTLLLAMFRAVSPYYYALHNGGNMFLYNDATYLAQQLATLSNNWKSRTDITLRAQSLLRLDNDVKALHAFAARAYSNEMLMQKTVVRDLLGGAQNLMHQPDKKPSVEAAVAHVQALAQTWEGILARSAWCQAVGALADAVAAKIVADVMDLPGVSADEAFAIAEAIAVVTELDGLFLPKRLWPSDEGHTGTGEEDEDEEQRNMPLTAKYAPGSWMRLQYLHEVLQSNLREVRFLWMESGLSYYFSGDEVVDLVKMSFEDNARTREVIREIMDNPSPRED